MSHELTQIGEEARTYVDVLPSPSEHISEYKTSHFRFTLRNGQRILQQAVTVEYRKMTVEWRDVPMEDLSQLEG